VILHTKSTNHNAPQRDAQTSPCTILIRKSTLTGTFCSLHFKDLSCLITTCISSRFHSPLHPCLLSFLTTTSRVSSLRVAESWCADISGSKGAALSVKGVSGREYSDSKSGLELYDEDEPKRLHSDRVSAYDIWWHLCLDEGVCDPDEKSSSWS
jgi:hypothetical protein